MRCLFAVFGLVSVVFGKLEFKYHTNKELEDILKKFEVTGKQKLRTNLYTIGNSSSVDNPFPLWVLELTAAPENQPGIPNVKLIGNMHGNEAGGREILLHYIEHLIESYGVDKNITWLLNNTRIHILPTINPDGFSIAGNSCDGSVGRLVPKGKIDLNRNFPDYFHPDPAFTQTKQAKESEAVVKWMKKTKFILSAALHEGAVVANYPYDAYNINGAVGEFLTPDDDVFKYLARVYARNHPLMSANVSCSSNDKKFEEGITNGAFWYQFDGGMGDYNYNFHGCMELTLELSCCKYPFNLTKLWSENIKSLTLYCMQANMGVTGRILDAQTQQPVKAVLKVVGRSMTFNNFDKTGEFWRILLPGNYQLEVVATGYYTYLKNFTVYQYETFPKLTNLTIYLTNSSIPTTTISTTTSTTISTTTSQKPKELQVIFVANRLNNPDVGELKSGQSKYHWVKIWLWLSLVVYVTV